MTSAGKEAVFLTGLYVGATLGVALMNFDFKAINGRQVLKILSGWVVTLPCAVSRPQLTSVAKKVN